MSVDTNLQLGPIRAEDIATLVEIHRSEIAYSLNSKLGASHLARLYEITRNDRESVIVAARLSGIPAGVVIATLDPSRLMRKVLASLEARQWLRLAIRVATTPSTFIEWLEGIWLERPVHFHGRRVNACLLAIAVGRNAQGLGVGKALVRAVDEFCSGAGCAAYRLDTRISNASAQEFYRRTGFVNIERRGRNLIWVKELQG
jgi:ribosomal protein S18 acetylase RimI-like enzyme